MVMVFPSKKTIAAENDSAMKETGMKALVDVFGERAATVFYLIAENLGMYDLTAPRPKALEEIEKAFARYTAPKP
jgi:hypothetical protein